MCVKGDVGAISESLKAHGQYRPITYQKSTGRILAGNHTWKAAKALGWKEINASAIECDDEQALRILLIDNRTSELCDLTKYSKLVAEIEKAKIPLEVSEFLIAAATRHIVFNYQKIAEFYPHQTAKIQKLMESSALVIIDAQDAIANGYAIFARTMNDLLIQDDDE
jgi:hypothetical protein